MTAYPRIGRAVTQALAENGMTRHALSEALGMSADGVGKIAAGKRVPTLETAAAMADLLDAHPIVTATIAARTRTCETCGATFVDRGRHNLARSCGVPCQRTRHQRIVHERSRDNLRGRAEVAENRLDDHRIAVRAFCMACSSNSLVCRMPECELRPVSPARLARRTAA